LNLRDLFSGSPAAPPAPPVVTPDPAPDPAPRRRSRYIRPARSFDAAVSDRLTTDWNPATVDINELLRAQLLPLQGRARHLVRNADYPTRWVSLVTDNVIGHQGIQIQSRAASRRGDVDKQAAREIEKHWREWCEEHCDFLGQMQFLDMQHAAAASWATNGEFLLRKLYGADGGRYGLRLQMMDCMRLDPGYNVELGSGREMKLGIERDVVGRILAYHLTNGRSGSTYTAANGYDYVRIEAAHVIHGFLVQEAGQMRGIPPMAPVMLRMQHLSKYEQAALVNARGGASTMGLLKNIDGDEDAIDGDTDDGDGPVFEFEPGTFRKIPKGWDAQKFDPAYPNGELPSFVKICLRGASAGLGVAYHGMTGDLESVNFSSGRIGELKERLTWMRLQTWMARRLVRDAFNSWLREALIRQIITVRRAPLSLSHEDRYRLVTYRYKRWPWVDPAKDANANETLHAMGARSISEIIRDLGGEPEETFEEIARERKIMASLGITPREVLGKVSKEAEVDGEDNDGAGDGGAGGPGQGDDS
jgi:lambda family phage portal protein